MKTTTDTHALKTKIAALETANKAMADALRDWLDNEKSSQACFSITKAALRLNDVSPPELNCDECTKAKAAYNRLGARMASNGNFGIVPLPMRCIDHN